MGSNKYPCSHNLAYPAASPVDICEMQLTLSPHCMRENGFLRQDFACPVLGAVRSDTNNSMILMIRPGYHY